MLTSYEGFVILAANFNFF